MDSETLRVLGLILGLIGFLIALVLLVLYGIARALRKEKMASAYGKATAIAFVGTLLFGFIWGAIEQTVKFGFVGGMVGLVGGTLFLLAFISFVAWLFNAS